LSFIDAHPARSLLLRAGLLLTSSLADLGCSDGGGAAASPSDAGTDATPDTPSPERDAPTHDGCDEYCHWDCFGGVQCTAGKVWLLGNGPAPCCRYGDPWPYGGIVCSTGEPIACEGGSCIVPDARYTDCLNAYGRKADTCSVSEGTVGTACELPRLYCPQGAPKHPGDACASDADCRPAAEGVSRLNCDVGGTATCVEEPRPDAPASYGTSCGFANDAFDPYTGATEKVVGGPNGGDDCALCQVAWNAGGCLRQGCTMTCVFDEDCPEGSVCLCDDAGGRYCAAATDRTTPEGRSAGLAPCP